MNVFGYAGPEGGLFVVELMYGCFQHLLIKYRKHSWTPLGYFYFCPALNSLKLIAKLSYKQWLILSMNSFFK